MIVCYSCRVMNTNGATVSTVTYTSELILCSTIGVHSATRHNIHMYTSIVCPAMQESYESRKAIIYPVNYKFPTNKTMRAV